MAAGTESAWVAAAQWAPWMAAVALAAAPWLPVDGWRFPICWIKQWTGLPCLSCGLTRSVLHTLHGDWAGALVLHPLGPLLAGLCALMAAALLVPVRLRSRSGRWLGEHPRWPTGTVLAVTAVLLLNGIYRLWSLLALRGIAPW